MESDKTCVAIGVLSVYPGSANRRLISVTSRSNTFGPAGASPDAPQARRPTIIRTLGKDIPT